MSLIRTSVRCALGIAAAAAAVNTASAIDISSYNSGTFTNVYLSGSTAIDNTLENAMIETAGPGGMCGSSIDVYTIGTPSSPTDRLFLCVGSASSGLSGASLAIFKESNVGSANGVTPLYTVSGGGLSGLQFIDPTKITDTNCATVTIHAAAGDFAAYTEHSGCPTADVTNNVIPTAGFSDVEAAILRTPAGGTLNTAAVNADLASTGTLDQIWALALTKNAYYALQAAEGLPTPSDAPANAPSLSKEQVASLLSNNIFAWTDLGLAPANSNVYICRRDVGSGTEASFEYLFLGERCSISSEQIPAENGTTVFANASGGKMRACLQNMFAGGNQTEFYPPNATVAVGPNWYAIGFLNGEVKASDLSGSGDSFRFPAIDGVGPTIANVQNGYYPYFSTGVAYTIKAGTGVPSGNPKTFVTNLLAKIGHPVFTADSNTNYTGLVPWTPANGITVGDASPAPLYAAANAPTIPATSGSASTNPTNAYTKAQGGPVDNCDTAVWDSGDLEGTETTTVQTKLLGTGQVND